MIAPSRPAKARSNTLSARQVSYKHRSPECVGWMAPIALRTDRSIGTGRSPGSLTVIFLPQFEVMAHRLMHCPLVGVPAPTTVVIHCNVNIRIEMEFVEQPPPFAV